MTLALSVLLATAMAGPMPAVAPEIIATAGATRETAIEACKPPGQRALLEQRSCPNGETPTYSRRGSVGPRHPFPEDMPRAARLRAMEQAMQFLPLQPGETDHHMVDAYEFSCGENNQVIYMDMYHCASDSPLTAGD